MKLFNELLTVEISPLGAELSSIRYQDHEFLWQGCQKYWKSRAINLFHFVGRNYQDSYTYEGKTYHINQHGFLRNTILEENQLNDTHGYFHMTDTEETLNVYPFHFDLEIHYHLEETTLSITYQIHNTNDTDMYFGFGGHPGFNIPFVDGHLFNEYQVDFIDANNPKRILYSEDNLPTGEEENYPLHNGTILPLNHSLFDHGILLLKNSGHKAVLSHQSKEGYSIQLEYPDCPYLGLWHTPQSDAPFICLEPWAALPGRDQILEDLSTKPNTIHLKPNEEYTNKLLLTIQKQ